MPTTSLTDLYTHMLDVLLDAERQTLAALPEWAGRAQDEHLHSALERRHRHTKVRVQRIQPLVWTRGHRAERISGASMRALIDEVQSLLPGIQDADAVDALIIASVQAIEHHQIALYGTTHTWAEQLGLSEDAAVLQSTLMDLTQAEALLPNIDGQEVGSQMAHPRDVEVHINSGGLAERAQRALGLTVRGSAAHPSGRSAGGP